MRIATWNVNSIGARLPNVLEWVQAAQPDVLLLQELKCEDGKFPVMEFKAAGYESSVFGQKSWNGVAILSKYPMSDVKRSLPGDDGDAQSRYIEATINGLRVASIYLPNGNPVDSDKYPYKLAWFDRLIAHARSLLAQEMPVVLAGDYNIIPAPEDCHDPVAWANDALFRLESRRKFRAMLNLGYTDAFRVHNQEPHRYTFWDYQAASWQRNAGIRIDHFLLSPQAADLMVGCTIDPNPRGLEKASDHVPVIVEIRA
jgi:exodeoxyribonuclease III